MPFSLVEKLTGQQFLTCVSAASLNGSPHSPLCGVYSGSSGLWPAVPIQQLHLFGLPSLIPAPLFWDELLNVHGKGLLAEHKKDNELLSPWLCS